MPEPEERERERERTTIVTSGGSGGAVWFIVGAIAVALVVVWYFGSGALDGTQTTDINVDVPEEVDVDVDAPEPAPVPEQSAEPAPSE